MVAPKILKGTYANFVADGLFVSSSDHGTTTISKSELNTRHGAIYKHEIDDIIKEIKGIMVGQSGFEIQGLGISGSLNLISSSSISLGDGTGLPTFSINKLGSSVSRIDWKDAGVVRWRFQNHTNEDLILYRYDGSGTDQNEVLTLDIDTGLLDLGNDLSLTSSSPTFTVGDGTGQPQIDLDKAAGSQAVIKFSDAGIRRWQMNLDTGENLEFNRYYDNGNFNGNPIQILVADGSITMEGDLSLTSSAPTLTVGDGSGGASVIIDGPASGGADASLEFHTTGSREWSLVQDASAGSPLRLFRYRDGSFQGTTIDISLTDGSINFEGSITMNSASPTFRLGNGSGSPINRLQKSDAGNASWMDMLSNGNRSWDCIFDSSEDIRIDRYIAGTIKESSLFKIQNSDGKLLHQKDVDFGGDLTLTASLSVGSFPTASLGGTAIDVKLYANNGMPLDSFGSNGDFYFQKDGSSGVSIFQRNSGAWTVVGGGTIPIWTTDAPPTSSTSYDDEFTSTTLNPKWSTLNNDTDLTVIASNPHGLTLRQATGVSGLAGVYQSSIPAGDFQIVAKIGLTFSGSITSQFWSGGIFIGGDLGTNPTTDPIRLAALSRASGASSLKAQVWTDYNSFSSEASVSKNLTGCYLRIIKKGSLWQAHWSDDGIGWSPINNETSIGFTPSTIGILVDNNSSGESQDVNIIYFRVQETASTNLSLHGSVVNYTTGS